MSQTLWDEVKKYYEEQFSIPQIVTEYISVQEILKRSATGYSNRRIARQFNLPTKYVENVLIDHLLFTGWESDLDFNPLALYNKVYGDYVAYNYEIQLTTPIVYSKFIVNISYNVSKEYNIIKEKIKKYESKS